MHYLPYFQQNYKNPPLLIAHLDDKYKSFGNYETDLKIFYKNSIGKWNF